MFLLWQHEPIFGALFCFLSLLSKNCWAKVIKRLDNHKGKIEHLLDKDMFCILRCKNELFVNHIFLAAKQYLFSTYLFATFIFTANILITICLNLN